MSNVTLIKAPDLEVLSGVPDCWYGMGSSAEEILATLNAAHDRPLTLKERHRLQWNLETLSSIAHMTLESSAKAGLFLPADEYKRQDALFMKEVMSH